MSNKIVFSKIAIQESELSRVNKEYLCNYEIVREVPVNTTIQGGKSTLCFTSKNTKALDVCATFSNRYICCNFYVLRALSNCPYDCSYCFLQGYLNNYTTSIVVDIQGLMMEVKSLLKNNPNKFFRIGTWELGDSLALSEYTDSIKKLILEFAKLNNVILELRTKSDKVDDILNLKHNGRTVIGFSLNPQSIIDLAEHKTANLQQRLHAMKRVVNSGYLVSLHLDPIILLSNWEEEYLSMIEQVFSLINKDQIAWISISALRFDKKIKSIMFQRFKNSKILGLELSLSTDNKYRHLKPLRIRAYKKIIEKIKEYCSDTIVIYLCMESPDVWKKVFGVAPKSSQDLEYQISHNLYSRFAYLFS